jgi:succinoglycan biosynthesis protein ExoM
MLDAVDNAVDKRVAHVAICVCTYKRPHLLLRCLQEIEKQATDGLFTMSIVVCDNDVSGSAEETVARFAEGSSISVVYCAEPQQNIARARNRAIANAKGEWLAFIDDDEFPAEGWLLALFQACSQFKVDGALGPVLRHFDQAPPKWMEKSDFYKRPINPTGSVVQWREARTGNVLINNKILAAGEEPFRPEFRAGEDQDFFRRKIEQGNTFTWSAEAAVYEVVPPSRWRRAYLLRKALLRGASASLQPSCNGWSIAKSLIAVPGYALALPAAFVLGQHRFMTLLVKICDHLGKLLALVGINPVKEQYVTE